MPQYNVPSYFKGGILPRRTEYGELRVGSVLVLKFGDVVKVIPQSEWPAIIASENKPECSSLIWNIYDQDGVGSCASESSAKMVEVIRERAGRPRVQLNPWFTYHTVSGGSDRGSTLDDNIEFLMTKGACPESVYARSKGWKPTPPAEAYKAALDYRIQEIFDLAPGSTFATEFGTMKFGAISPSFGVFAARVPTEETGQ